MKSYVQFVVHFVWATLGRQSVLRADDDGFLRSILAKQCERLRCILVAFGAASDHVHVLLASNSLCDFTQVVGAMKGASSWALSRRLQERFKWQQGYAAFSVSRWDLPKVAAYVDGQRERHARGDLSPSLERFVGAYGDSQTPTTPTTHR